MNKLVTFVGIGATALAVGCSKKSSNTASNNSASPSGGGSAAVEAAPSNQVPAWKSAEMKDTDFHKVLVVGSTTYAITDKEVFKSTDGGATFTRTAMVDNKADLDAMYAPNADELFVASNGEKEIMYHSTDGGKTFKPSELADDILSIHAMTGTSANDIYAVGGAGQVLHFDGKTWKDLRGENNDDVSVLQGVLLDGRDLWAVGTDCDVLHMQGDKIAVVKVTDCKDDLQDIVKVGSSLVVSADKGQFLKYDGKSWTMSKPKIGTEDDNDVNGIAASGGTIYAATSNGIARSTDLGARWTLDEVGSFDYLAIAASGKTIVAVAPEVTAHAAGWYTPETAAAPKAADPAQPSAKPVAR
jgi:hypothetical protein